MVTQSCPSLTSTAWKVLVLPQLLPLRLYRFTPYHVATKTQVGVKLEKVPPRARRMRCARARTLGPALPTLALYCW